MQLCVNQKSNIPKKKRNLPKGNYEIFIFRENINAIATTTFCTFTTLQMSTHNVFVAYKHLLHCELYEANKFYTVTQFKFGQGNQNTKKKLLKKYRITNIWLHKSYWVFDKDKRNG